MFCIECHRSMGSSIELDNSSWMSLCRNWNLYESEFNRFWLKWRWKFEHYYWNTIYRFISFLHWLNLDNNAIVFEKIGKALTEKAKRNIMENWLVSNCYINVKMIPKEKKRKETKSNMTMSISSQILIFDYRKHTNRKIPEQSIWLGVFFSSFSLLILLFVWLDWSHNVNTHTQIPWSLLANIWYCLILFVFEHQYV